MERAMVFAVAGWSGFFVMAIELLSGRILAPNFGSGIYVWGGIITLFMVALAIGYLLGGRYSIHWPSLSRLAVLLLVSALASLPVVTIGDAMLDRIFDAIHDPRYGSLVSVTLLFFLPVLLCGMISPYAVRLLVHEYELSGHFAGLLYFVSTFGSAAGTLATSFYLVLAFEIREIVGGLVTISVTLSVLAFTFARSRRVVRA